MRLDCSAADDAIARVRASAADSIVLVVPAGLGGLELSQVTAAVAPLAVERAPAGRVNAVLAAAGADPADIDAAVEFLERARSTTGQLLTVEPPARPHGPSAAITTA